MKRIEAIMKPEKMYLVADALRKFGVGGVTVSQVRGRGSSRVPVISGLRGTARFVADFNARSAVYTIGDDSKVDQVVSEILNVLHETGKKGEGKIFVTPVDDVIDICTKERGKAAL